MVLHHTALEEVLIPATLTTVEVSPGVYFVQGPASNWTILAENGEVSLIDCGYPGDWQAVQGSLRSVGYSPADVARLFVTHGHSDHIGSAERFRRNYGTEVLACAEEARHARRLVLNQVSRDEVSSHASDPLVQAWMRHAIAAGGLGDVAVAAVTEIAERLPGPGPLGPVPRVVPGHTPGHTVFEIPSAKVLVTGDALVTGHPISTTKGPQMLHPMFHTDLDQARQSLQLLTSIDAHVLLPGHGPALSISPAEAVRRTCDEISAVAELAAVWDVAK